MANLKPQDLQYKTKSDIVTHVGDEYAEFMGAIVPPIFQNSLFLKPTPYNGIPEDNEFVYTRVNNPTIDIAERKIAALECAEAAACFSSGMGAISAAIMHFVKKDCHIIAPHTIYGPTRTFITKYLAEKFGVTHTFVHGSDLEEIKAAIRPETTLIYLESPSSLVLYMQDIEEIAKIAKEHGIGTAIDNTYATPLHQNPYTYGIDLVCHTASKYMGGHSDIVAGVVAGSKEMIEQIAHEERELLGSCMDPHQAWLLIRGLRTMPVRVKAHGESGLKVAKWLEQQPCVKQVFYPGLDSHPQKELVDKYLKGGLNGLIGFVYDGTAEQAREFMYSLKMFQYGVSWGGFESLVAPGSVGLTDEEAAAIGMPANVIRIHVGLEDVDTLIADLAQAFEASKKVK
ncbi:MAG: PLP-dependent transferase [Ruminococcaceae bacterium]|nr:PLP-dependent transferase [Oscillospiraceae bacterium]MBQ9969365.1 PLP-dependent transferase [Oscillospiraceae bacterium]